MTNLNWWKQNGSVKLPDLDKIRYEEQQVWEWTSMKETELLRVYWQYMTKEENELLRKLFDYLYLHYDEIFKYKMYEVWYTIWLIKLLTWKIDYEEAKKIIKEYSIEVLEEKIEENVDAEELVSPYFDRYEELEKVLENVKDLPRRKWAEQLYEYLMKNTSTIMTDPQYLINWRDIQTLHKDDKFFDEYLEINEDIDKRSTIEMFELLKTWRLNKDNHDIIFNTIMTTLFQFDYSNTETCEDFWRQSIKNNLLKVFWLEKAYYNEWIYWTINLFTMEVSNLY